MTTTYTVYSLEKHFGISAELLGEAGEGIDDPFEIAELAQDRGFLTSADADSEACCVEPSGTHVLARIEAKDLLVNEIKGKVFCRFFEIKADFAFEQHGAKLYDEFLLFLAQCNFDVPAEYFVKRWLTDQRSGQIVCTDVGKAIFEDGTVAIVIDMFSDMLEVALSVFSEA